VKKLLKFLLLYSCFLVLKVLKVCHVKENLKGTRCDRASVLGNPYDLVNEKQRDNVCDSHWDYVLAVHAVEEKLLDTVLDPSCVSNLPVSKTWKRATPRQIKYQMQRLVVLHASTDIHYISCWCRRSTQTTKPRCHCDNYVRFAQEYV